MSENKFDDLKTKVEAVLFAFGDWLSVDDIKQALKADSSKLIESALKDLKEKYKEGYAFSLTVNDSGFWKMGLKDEFEDDVSELVSGTEIPKNVLKVLSVLAYEQPVTKTRLNEILGRSVKQEVDYLYKAKFVDYEKKGIGRYYRVTRKFFDYFKIEDEEAFRKQVNEQLNTFLQEPEEIVEAEEREAQEQSQS